MGRILAKLFFSLLCISKAHAQEVADSIYLEGGGLTPKEIEELTTPMHHEGSVSWEEWNREISPMNAKDLDMGMLPPTERRYVLSPTLDIYGIPKASTLPRWATGYMYGYNSQFVHFLSGYSASAGMGIHQQLGRYWTTDASVNLSKYSVFYNTASFNGAVTWTPSRYLSITAFGSYTPGTFFSPIQLGSAFQWGGYIDLHTDTDIPFGIDLGARSYYDPFVGHETTPIVQPYVKLGGSKIGFDFGPMIRNAMERKNGSGNGVDVIPKPIKAVPQIAPRR